MDTTDLRVPGSCCVFNIAIVVTETTLMLGMPRKMRMYWSYPDGYHHFILSSIDACNSAPGRNKAQM